MKYVKDIVHFMVDLDSSKMKKVKLGPSQFLILLGMLLEINFW